MTRKYYLQILGCQMNISDAERITTVLREADWQPTKKLAEADLCLFVTCSVRQRAEDRIYSYIHNLAAWKKGNPKRLLGLTGCMVRSTSSQETNQQDKLLGRFPRLDFVFRIEDTAKLPELIGGKKTKPVYEKTYFSIKPTNTSKSQAFIPIMTGCDNWCTYCIVPLTRGRETSRSEKEILSECKEALKNGVIEITLLGQNVDSYQKKPRAFAKLLTEVAKLSGLQRLRFTSSHPQDLGEDVMEAMAAHRNIERHLHLPVQHGDDKILRHMNRNYSVKEYLAKIKLFRKKLPNASVTTDLIVGFPGETDRQFQNLLKFYRQAAFDFAYISRYSPRSGTAAAKFKNQIPMRTIAKRWHSVNDLLKTTTEKIYSKLKGKSLEILVECYTKGICEGRSSEYYLVKFLGQQDLIGQLVTVIITEPREVELWGETV